MGSMTLTTPRPLLILLGLSTRWRAPLPSRLLVFTSCGPAFLPTPPPLLPSCLPISLFSIAGVRILLLGSRSPIRHYYRHRAPLGVLVHSQESRRPMRRFFDPKICRSSLRSLYIHLVSSREQRHHTLPHRSAPPSQAVSSFVDGTRNGRSIVPLADVRSS